FLLFVFFFFFFFIISTGVFFFVFFFQAEDGIRDIGVTGVQTCALPICRRSQCAQPDDDRQRPDADHRRRRGARLRGHDARREAVGLRAADAQRAGQPVVAFVRQPPRLLDVSVRASEAGRDDRSGAHRAQRAVPRDRQRRRSAAPEGDERSD